MSSVDIFYLSLVLVAFFGFAASLAYFTQRDRLPKPTETPSKQAPAPAKMTAVKAAKVHEHA